MRSAPRGSRALTDLLPAMIAAVTGGGMTSLLGWLVWRTQVAMRLDRIERDLGRAEDSRKQLYSAVRSLERRIDRAGIGNDL